MVRILILILFLTTGLFQSAFAARIEGIITNEKNVPLPFCNVYIKGSDYACASNEQGFYSLAVPKGNYVIVFQFIGYSKKEIDIAVTKELITLDIILIEEAEELSEIVISSDQEDPAYAIIRKAIEKRENHLKELGSYSCEVYIKGLQKLTEAPEKILGIELKTILDLDTNNTGVIYLSESSSTFYYQYPDKTKEIMKASIVSGDDKSFSWNDAASMQMNFYENLQTIEGFSQRGFVSPVAENAFFYYKYQLISSMFENNHQIFKIGIQPKRKTDPAFSGIIYITDDDYRYTGIKLRLLKENGMDFIDTFKVEQEYFYTDENQLALLSNKFNFDYSLFGIKGAGYFHAFYKDYSLNQIFGKNFFNGEVTKIEDGSNKKDSIYWSNIRPIQLTTEEISDYHTKDSLQVIKESPAYKDSMDNIFNKFSLADIVTGYSYRNTQTNIFINTNQGYDLVQYNTVEGYVINPALRISKRWENKDELSFTPGLRYGIGSDKLYGNLGIKYLYDQKSQSFGFVNIGSKVNQFNEQGINPLANTVATLFFETNRLKLYENRFLNAGYSHEIVNGLYWTGQINYSKRKQLFNLSDPSPWIDYDEKGFTSNNYPFYPDTLTYTIPTKFSLAISLQYNIGQKYIMEPGSKYIISSKYPTLHLLYEKAFTYLIVSGVEYDKIEMKINDNIALGLFGNLVYTTTMGIMPAHNELNVADQFNFAGNETFTNKVTEGSFFLLPYYAALSDEYYFTSHIQWHTEGTFFRKLPLFKQFKLEPVFSFNYLQNDAVNSYMEFAVGIEHIFKLGRIDFAYSPYRFEAPYLADSYQILVGIGF